MASAIEKISAEAKKIRKASPKMEWKTAIAKASALYRKGALGKVTKVAAVGKATKKKAKPAAKRPRIASKKITRYNTNNGKVAVVEYKPKKGGSTVVKTSIAKLDQGKAIMGNIAKLERERKTKKHKHEKDFYAIVINGEHAKLKKLAKR